MSLRKLLDNYIGHQNPDHEFNYSIKQENLSNLFKELIENSKNFEHELNKISETSLGWIKAAINDLRLYHQIADDMITRKYLLLPGNPNNVSKTNELYAYVKRNYSIHLAGLTKICLTDCDFDLITSDGEEEGKPRKGEVPRAHQEVLEQKEFQVIEVINSRMNRQFLNTLRALQNKSRTILGNNINFTSFDLFVEGMFLFGNYSASTSLSSSSSTALPVLLRVQGSNDSKVVSDSKELKKELPVGELYSFQRPAFESKLVIKDYEVKSQFIDVLTHLYQGSVPSLELTDVKFSSFNLLKKLLDHFTFAIGGYICIRANGSITCEPHPQSNVMSIDVDFTGLSLDSTIDDIRVRSLQLFLNHIDARYESIKDKITLTLITREYPSSEFPFASRTVKILDVITSSPRECKLNFAARFPALQKLQLNVSNPVDQIRSVRKLTALTMTNVTVDAEEKDVIELLQRNPKLRTLHFESSARVVKSVHDYLQRNFHHSLSSVPSSWMTLVPELKFRLNGTDFEYIFKDSLIIKERYNKLYKDVVSQSFNEFETPSAQVISDIRGFVETSRSNPHYPQKFHNNVKHLESVLLLYCADRMLIGISSDYNVFGSYKRLKENLNSTQKDLHENVIAKVLMNPKVHGLFLMKCFHLNLLSDDHIVFHFDNLFKSNKLQEILAKHFFKLTTIISLCCKFIQSRHSEFPSDDFKVNQVILDMVKSLSDHTLTTIDLFRARLHKFKTDLETVCKKTSSVFSSSVVKKNDLKKEQLSTNIGNWIPLFREAKIVLSCWNSTSISLSSLSSSSSSTSSSSSSPVSLCASVLTISLSDLPKTLDVLTLDDFPKPAPLILEPVAFEPSPIDLTVESEMADLPLPPPAIAPHLDPAASPKSLSSAMSGSLVEGDPKVGGEPSGTSSELSSVAIPISTTVPLVVDRSIVPSAPVEEEGVVSVNLPTISANPITQPIAEHTRFFNTASQTTLNPCELGVLSLALNLINEKGSSISPHLLNDFLNAITKVQQDQKSLPVAVARPAALS